MLLDYRVSGVVVMDVARPWHWLLVTALAALVALSIGLDHEVSNHNQYMLAAISRLEPGTFAADWFTTQTTDYHSRFTQILVWMGSIGPLPWILTSVNALLNALAVVLVYRLVRHVAPAAALWVTLAIAAVVIVGETRSIAETYLLISYGQPSSFAQVFLLLAAERFVAGRLWQAGAALAMAGWLHLNYLVLGCLMFGVAHLMLAGPLSDFVRRSFALFTLVAVVLVFSLPTLLAAAGGGPEVTIARDFYLHNRVPHHYLPQEYWPQLVPFLGWQLLAWIGVGRLLRSSAAGRRWVVLYGSGLFLIALLHQLTTWIFVPTVAMLFVSRLGPLVTLLGQGILLVELWRLAGDRDALRAHLRSPASWACLVSGVLLLIVGVRCASFANAIERVDGVVVAAGIAVSLVLVMRSAAGETQRGRAAGIALMALVALVVASHSGLHRFRESVMVFGRPAQQAQADALYAWARTTPLDTVFAVPPALQSFRLQSRRSVIVDWKSVPGLPREQIEWYRRLQAVSGSERLPSSAAAERGYARLTAERAAALAQEFGASYAVLRKAPAAGAPAWCQPAFENSEFVACRLAPHG